MTQRPDEPGHTPHSWWMEWTKRGDDLTAEQRDELEARTDPLIDLVGYYERHRPESSVYEDARFLAHLAKEWRETGKASGSLSAQSVIALRENILESWHARRLHVTLAREPLHQELLPYGGPVSGMLEELEREHLAADLDLAIAAGEGRELWDAEVEACVSLPAEMPRGKYVVLRITGDSMVPLLHGGDRVLVKLGTEPVEETVAVARGDDGGFVVKEVGKVTESSIELESLNPTYAPLRLRRKPGCVLGTVIMRWCGHGQR